MGLKDVDIESALRRLAERKIEEAVREGKFDNLPGKGKPLDLEPLPADENARMRWWALRILKQNDVTPDEVQWRKRIDLLKAELDRAPTEGRVRALVDGINDIVRQINTMGTNAIPLPASPVSLDVELACLRARQAAEAAAGRPARAAPPPLPPMGKTARVLSCGNPLCGVRNPLSAQYCRRCGTPVA